MILIGLFHLLCCLKNGLSTDEEDSNSFGDLEVDHPLSNTEKTNTGIEEKFWSYLSDHEKQLYLKEVYTFRDQVKHFLQDLVASYLRTQSTSPPTIRRLQEELFQLQYLSMQLSIRYLLTASVIYPASLRTALQSEYHRFDTEDGYSLYHFLQCKHFQHMLTSIAGKRWEEPCEEKRIDTCPLEMNTICGCSCGGCDTAPSHSCNNIREQIEEVQQEVREKEVILVSIQRIVCNYH